MWIENRLRLLACAAGAFHLFVFPSPWDVYVKLSFRKFNYESLTGKSCTRRRDERRIIKIWHNSFSCSGVHLWVPTMASWCFWSSLPLCWVLNAVVHVTLVCSVHLDHISSCVCFRSYKWVPQEISFSRLNFIFHICVYSSLFSYPWVPQGLFHQPGARWWCSGPARPLCEYELQLCLRS